MFDIRVLPGSESEPDGERRGRITIGAFSEVFACHDADLPVDDFTEAWKQRLRSLIEGAPAVALVFDPRFAWIVFREGEHCFVQQRLKIDGCFDSISPRQTVNEDGESISEWPVSLQAIARFVGA